MGQPGAAPLAAPSCWAGSDGVKKMTSKAQIDNVFRSSLATKRRQYPKLRPITLETPVPEMRRATRAGHILTWIPILALQYSRLYITLSLTQCIPVSPARTRRIAD